MKKGVRSLSVRFYLEVVAGLAGILLFGLTLISNDWIEIVFRVDPDAGNGSAEFVVCVALLSVAAVGAWLARSEWRRSTHAAAGAPSRVD